MNRYFLIEEFKGTILDLSSPYIPVAIVGYGKHSLEEECKILRNIIYSPLSTVIIRRFYTNKEYNSYIREMRSLGVHIDYSKELKE